MFTDGHVLLAGGVGIKREASDGRVPRAGDVENERLVTQERVVANVAALVTNRSRLRRKRKPCEREREEKETAYNPDWLDTR